MTRKTYKYEPKKRPARPDTWKSGPDETRHDQYHAWLRHRAQANFRKEVYELEFEDWVQAWGSDWEARGRTKESKMLVRIDYDLGWNLSNVEVITRHEHGIRQINKRFGRA